MKVYCVLRMYLAADEDRDSWEEELVKIFASQEQAASFVEKQEKDCDHYEVRPVEVESA